jgi:hypothetical protein
MPKIPRWEPDDALMEELPGKEEYEAYKRETLGLAHPRKTEEEENADRQSFVRQMMGFSKSDMYQTLMGRGREPEVLVLPAQKVCEGCRIRGVVGFCEHIGSSLAQTNATDFRTVSPVCQPCRDQGIVGECKHRSGQYPPWHGPRDNVDALLSEMQKDGETYERESRS